MQKQVREMQALLASERSTGASRDKTVSVVMNGGFELLEISFADHHIYDKTKTARAIKEAFENASGKIKESLAEKMRGLQ